MNYTIDSTDKELAEGLVNSNKNAFRLIFDRYYNHLVGTAINILKDQNKSEDIVQDVFAKIWENNSLIDPGNNIGGYLKRSVINRCLNFIRDNKRIVTPELPYDEPSRDHDAVDKLQGQDLSEIIQLALGKLPERCRLIFTLKRFDGMSLNEIAEQLDISPKTVENQMTKALKHLKKALLPYLKNNPITK